MRYLAIDYGAKRTGLAVCDAAETIASPYAVLHGGKDLVQQIGRVLRSDEDVAEFWIELGPTFVHIRYFALRAEDGAYKGCLEVDLTKLKAAVADLEKQVAAIKGKGDKAGAEKLKADFVDANDDWAKLRGTLSERWLRAPKASFVYSVKM